MWSAAVVVRSSLKRLLLGPVGMGTPVMPSTRAWAVVPPPSPTKPEVDVEAARLEGSPAQVGAPDEGVLERVLDQLRVGVGVGVVEGLDDLVDEVDVGRGEPAERGAKAQAVRPLDQRRDPDVDGGVGQELGAQLPLGGGFLGLGLGAEEREGEGGQEGKGARWHGLLLSIDGQGEREVARRAYHAKKSWARAILRIMAVGKTVA